MEQSFDILVIILSTLLAVFLIVAITISVMMYKLITAVRQVVDRGEQFVAGAEELGQTLKRNASAAGLASLLVRQVAKAVKSKK
ncbi:MAG: hypothetical protein QG629_64 [Patescibacteria group bacterium]|nr:hypothetical protein [Candidatus Saccharibacteria bacterium]MDQ5962982.1 hypothetical protein [Patescibacteria group bacterium]